jgi:hypothetical protein
LQRGGRRNQGAASKGSPAISTDILDSAREFRHSRSKGWCGRATLIANTLLAPPFGQLRIPAKLNARSGERERGFRASRTLIGAKRRGQSVW